MEIKNLNINTVGVEWLESSNVSDYKGAVEFMENRATDIRKSQASECVWLVEHTPMYTGGTSAEESDLIKPEFPVYETGRGGQYTYHGSGQRTAYIMLDLEKRKLGIKEYVTKLEQLTIDTMAEFDLIGERRTGRVGIWIKNPDNTEDKICAIGVRVKKWVSYHGIAFNINPDLSHYNGIVPCGINDKNLGITSFEKLGIKATMTDFDQALIKTFAKIF